jgi:predicted phosphodiesterase
VLSDIHGNRWALESVLEDIRRRGIDRIVNLGDSLYGPLDPAGTADILIPLDIPAVRGNEDRIIIDPTIPGDDSPTLRFVRDSLTKAHIEWLESLPASKTIYGDFFLCHGTPESDEEYLIHGVHESGVSKRGEGEITDILQGISQKVVLCGHDHMQSALSLPGGRLVVDPGSVGCQAFSDDHPFPHVMESGSPHARYSIVVRDESGWRAESLYVAYNWDEAAAAAMKNGRPDWAGWIETGRGGV